MTALPHAQRFAGRFYGWLFLAAPLAMAAMSYSPVSAEAESRTSAYSCQLNARFAMGAESRTNPSSAMKGFGLATCRNSAQGFEFDLPIKAELVLAAKPRAEADTYDATVAADSAAPFAVARAFDEIYDSFEPVSAANAAITPDSKRVLLRGRNRGLIVELNLSGSSPALEKMDVRSLTFSMDSTAPTLAGDDF